ncbi:expressed unknown protein [Seminavis robusta]|uniref:Uncharacterized protein n=1 Tax=Seminavis robusta TaxID=568900 RepID=A0A9N8HQ89_9STRA|nr:expressed unknown protein [Seminavis robusta]|eukprot:Sro1414_g270630.1 n/a (371) ;mRNA; r:3787-4899
MSKRTNEDEDAVLKRQRLEPAVNDEAMSVNRQILEALKAQNSALATQTSLLRSIDARLGRIENLGRTGSNNGRRGRGAASTGRLERVVTGSWKFVESQEAKRKRESFERHPSFHCSLIPSFPMFAGIDNTGLVIQARPYPTTGNMSEGMSILFGDDHGLYTSHIIESPAWTTDHGQRSLLPELVFNNDPKVKLKSGIYCLQVRYKNATETTATLPTPTRIEAGIIVGEIEFNSNGTVMAQGADWDRLLDSKRQTQLPYSHGARGVPTWSRRKISEPWLDGEVLKFRIDTNESTIVFQREGPPEKLFWNVLAFTNNRQFPDFLRLYAFCGGVPQSSFSTDGYRYAFGCLNGGTSSLTILPDQSSGIEEESS